MGQTYSLHLPELMGSAVVTYHRFPITLKNRIIVGLWEHNFLPLNMKLVIFTTILLFSMISAEKSTCPLVGISYYSGSCQIARISGIEDWRHCGAICHGMSEPEDCKFWTYYDYSKQCSLNNSDECFHTYDGSTSGDDLCY